MDRFLEKKVLDLDGEKQWTDDSIDLASSLHVTKDYLGLSIQTLSQVVTQLSWNNSDLLIGKPLFMCLH